MVREPRLRERDTRKTRAMAVGSSYYYDPKGVKPGVEGTVQTVTGVSGSYEICYDENHGRPPYFIGGPFFHALEDFSTPIVASGDYRPVGAASTGNLLRGYTGGFIINQWPSLPNLGSLPKSPSSYDSHYNPDDLSGRGNAAYNRLRPKLENAGLAQALLEAGDLPGMLKGTAKYFSDIEGIVDGVKASFKYDSKWKGIKIRPEHLKKIRMSQRASDHFINVMFGWKPFLKDLGDLLDLCDQYFTKLKKAEKLNGRWVRRSFTEPPIVSSTQVWNTTYAYSHQLYRSSFLPAIGGAQSATMVVHRQKSTEIWYEGRFRVYRPEFDPGVEMHDQVRSAKQFLTMGGFNIKPSVIWAVTPWSWLADWFGNIGGNIRALEDYLSGEVVSKYMYIMRRTYDQYVYMGTQTFNNGPTLSGSSTRRREVKRRESAASPFGFSVNGDLSPVQLLILSALGISRTSL